MTLLTELSKNRAPVLHSTEHRGELISPEVEFEAIFSMWLNDMSAAQVGIEAAIALETMTHFASDSFSHRHPNTERSWSLLIFPFSKEEIQRIFGLSPKQCWSSLTQSRDIVGLAHPYDHLGRHVFYNSCDVVKLLYDGPLDVELAFDTLFDYGPEDAGAFLCCGGLEFGLIAHMIVEDQVEIAGESVDVSDAAKFLGACRSVYAWLNRYIIIGQLDGGHVASDQEGTEDAQVGTTRDVGTLSRTETATVAENLGTTKTLNDKY